MEQKPSDDVRQPPKQVLPRGVLARSGLPVQAGARLNTGLKAPRDLTLGGKGTTTKKSSFQPNLAPNLSKRNSTSSTEAAQNASSPKRGNGGFRGQASTRRGEGRSGSRGRGRGAANLIQLDGIFEAAAVNQSRSDRYRQVNNDSTGATPETTLPKYVPMIDEDSLETERTIERLTKAEFIEFNDKGTGLPPLVIPLGITEEFTCKTEIDDEDSSQNGDDSPKERSAPKLKQEQSPREKPLQTLREVCLGTNATKEENEGSNLILFQLPRLPDPVQTEIKVQNPSDGSQPQRQQYKLKSMPKGYFGKLQVLRDGRVRLCSGKISMDLRLTPDSPFYQEVLDIQGRMMVPLAKVEKKIICKLNVQELLAEEQKT